MWKRSDRGIARFLALTSLLLVLLLADLSVSHAALPQSMAELAASADAAYRDGDHARAIQLYQDILDAGFVSGTLWYNLGNAHYKAGDLGRSILAYERAARLLPHDGDVRHNLTLARERTVDRIDSPPRLVIWTWLDTLRDAIAPSLLATLAWALALLTTLLFALRVNVASPRLRSALRGGLILTSVLFLLAIALVGLRAGADSGPDAAVVLADKVDAHTAPDPSAEAAFVLHEGTTVDVLQVLSEWAEVRLADGRQGWLPLRSFEVI